MFIFAVSFVHLFLIHYPRVAMPGCVVTCCVWYRWVRVLARGGRQRVAGGRHPRVRHEPAAAAALLSARAPRAPGAPRAPRAPGDRLLAAAPAPAPLSYKARTSRLLRYHYTLFYPSWRRTVLIRYYHYLLMIMTNIIMNVKCYCTYCRTVHARCLYYHMYV